VYRLVVTRSANEWKIAKIYGQWSFYGLQKYRSVLVS
jgi:hypothetical protein